MYIMHFVLQDVTLLRPTSGKLKFIFIFFIVIYLFYFIFYSAENKSAIFRLVEMYILHVPTKEKSIER